MFLLILIFTIKTIRAVFVKVHINKRKTVIEDSRENVGNLKYLLRPLINSFSNIFTIIITKEDKIINAIVNKY